MAFLGWFTIGFGVIGAVYNKFWVVSRASLYPRVPSVIPPGARPGRGAVGARAVLMSQMIGALRLGPL